MTLAARLPEYPWDELGQLKEKAAAFPGGLVDLSIGTPVDPVPAVIREALAAAADSPGYPQTAGTPALRSAAAGWLSRSLGVTVEPEAILPVIGTKEAVAWLPTMLGLGAGDAVLYPELAYPTYDIGARLAGASPVATDDPAPGLAALGGRPGLRWLNSPSNPTGEVKTASWLRSAVSWARAHGVVLASDECYVELGWTASPVSVLHPSVCDGVHDGLLAVHSLSKRSNLAGYRAGFIAGDPALLRELLLVGKQAGMIVPGPVQAAMTAALNDDEHARAQRARYEARRSVLASGLRAAGFRIDHSEAGLYLWATHPGHDARSATEWLATSAGILAGPGHFYGTAGERHVRLALTATDERVAAAGTRLADLG
ncbi:MAG TPA: succinyldiaminopimelate transaminase [Trebonia sp.]|nr:succinyldiaminopimelate transaminase [Trebonia sp.]